MRNDGLIIGGNANVNIGNSIVGKDGSITVTTTNVNKQSDEDKLFILFESLLEKIQTTQEHIPEKEDIIASVASLQDEIRKEKPNKITLRSVGKAILENLKYVKDIAPIAESIWQHITQLLVK